MPADHAVTRRYDRASTSEPPRSSSAARRRCIADVVRFAVRLVLILLAGIIAGDLTGCAATPTFAPLSWLRPAPDAEADKSGKATKDAGEKTEIASTKDDGKQDKTADKKTPGKSPWKGEETKTADAGKSDATPKASKTAEKDSAEIAAKEPKSETKTAATGPVHPTHDAQTLKLIEEELQDATPEERAQLFADMKGLEPHLVQQFLRVRRMVNQVHDRTQTDDVTLASADQAAGDQKKSPVQHALETRTADSGSHGQQQQLAASDGSESGTAASGNGRTIRDPNIQTVGDGAPLTTQAAFGHSATAATGGQQRTSTYGSNGSSAVLTGIISEPDPGSAATGTTAGPANLAMTAAEVRSPSEHAAAPGGGTAQPTDQIAGDPLASSKWNDDLERLLSLTEAQITQLPSGQSEDDPAYQQYVRRHVELRLLYLMSGDRARALEAIPAIDPAHQEFWSQVLWGLANYFDSQNIPDTHDRVTQTVTQLRGAIERLQPKANLEIRNVNFCYKISSYGNYEKFDRDEFTPGQQVLVYAEVDNFTSEWSSTSQKYRTQLKSTLQLFTASGQMVKEFEFPPTEDLCQNRRRDYFHSYQVAVPRNGIGRGPHYMVLTIEDMIGRKVHDYRVNFMVK